MTRLQERNVHCLDKKAAGGQKAQLTQTFTGHASDGAQTGASDKLRKPLHRWRSAEEERGTLLLAES